MAPVLEFKPSTTSSIHNIMVNQAEILYNAYKAQGTLTDMSIKVKVYGHDDLATLTISDGTLTLVYADGTSDTYSEV